MLPIGMVVTIKEVNNRKPVRLVDGESNFNEPSVSHGFVHFADPITGKKIGFAGIEWTKKHILTHYGVP